MNERWIWRLHKRPEGMDFAPAFEFKSEPIPELSPGELLIKNIYIGMDAGTRNWLHPREDGFDVPLPLGSAMIGILVGTIEESNHPAYTKGSLVRAYGQWADYSIVNPAEARVFLVDPDIDDIRQYIVPYYGTTDGMQLGAPG